MKLYTIAHDNWLDMPEPLFDSETGSPSVFFSKEKAEAEVAELNNSTDGGYFLVEFDSEDETT